MQRKFGQGGALLASVLVLGGCSWVNPALTTEADAGFGAPRAQAQVNVSRS